MPPTELYTYFEERTATKDRPGAVGLDSIGPNSRDGALFLLQVRHERSAYEPMFCMTTTKDVLLLVDLDGRIGLVCKEKTFNVFHGRCK